jgi:hypothetical protein
MSIWAEFQKIAKIVDCSDFQLELDNLMVYMKMSGEGVNVNEDNIFDWMGLIDVGEYKNYEIDDDISNNGEWDESTLNTIKLKIEDLTRMLYSILDDFQKKTNITIYFEYNNEEYFAYLDFRTSEILNLVLSLHQTPQTIIN